ncbi:hypothetical protein HID58_077559 [Brassica napus]|uniref:Phosphoglycerate mutase-like protein 4 n=1 Tax=Brassica napus TaxID=3708 RepID=A0ABQ7YSC1_BRANA|nr:hypothetical protein HID58_077559 [Brassica napus]
MAESSLNSSVDQTYTEIVVVRHGETYWNAERKIQGHIDVELNDAGRQQAVRFCLFDYSCRLVYQEASKIRPIAYKAFLSNRTDVDIPGGGESLDKLYDRCTSALQRIGDKHKARPKARKVDKILNTSVSVFRLFDGDKWRIHVWGDMTHLDQTGFLKSGFGGDRTSG